MVKKMYIAYILLLVLGSSPVIAQSTKQPLRIGLIADIQYADKPNGKTRYYRGSLQKLENAVRELNQEELKLTVVLGDYVDEGPKDLKPVMDRLAKLKSSVLGVLGNHDYPSEPDKKLHEKFKMPASYYSVEQDQYRFIILNTNELSSYGGLKGTNLEGEYTELVARQNNEGRKNVQPWNGGISREQLQWLKSELTQANENKQRVFVFTHHPLLPENGYEALNNREILDVLVKNKQVKAVISGHHHAGGFAMYKDLSCIVLEGMIETEDETAFGTMTVFEDKFVIEGKGRLTSRTVHLR